MLKCKTLEDALVGFFRIGKKKTVYFLDMHDGVVTVTGKHKGEVENINDLDLDQKIVQVKATFENK